MINYLWIYNLKDIFIDLGINNRVMKKGSSVMKWSLELVWWLITGIIVVGVLYPIVSSVGNYEYLVPNIVFIVVFVTAIRHIFFLKHSLIAKNNILKIVLIIACIPVLAYLVQYLNTFQTFLDNLDNKTWDAFFGNMEHQKQLKMHKYIRTEMLFFGTGAIISTIIFPIRMVLSIWRQRNRGTV